MGVEGREVAAGAGRDPAAEGGELERLREVAQGQVVLAELVLECGPAAPRPGSVPPATRCRSRARGRAGEVDRDRAAVPVADPRLDPADDAGAAAVGDRRRTLLLAEAEHRLDLGLIAGEGDQVGWVGKLAAKAAHDVAVGLAERVAEPLVTARR